MNNFEHLFGALRRVVLSERERDTMRFALKSHISMHPYRPQAPAWQRAMSRLETWLNSETFATHPAFAAAVLVLVVGVGTSFAAQSSLPGEPLYTFKTRVNEPLQGAFAVSQAAKTEWSAELTYRRLLEAEELAATGNLDAVASADIESKLDDAIANFATNVELLEKKDDVKAANVHSDFEASLNAHEAVLSSIPASNKGSTESIKTAVQKHAELVNKKRSAFEATLTATDSPAVKDAALKRKKQAKDVIGEVQRLSTKATDARTASSVSMVAMDAENDLKMGDNEAEQGRWGKAFSAFQDAARKAKETESSVQTRNWLKTRFGVGTASNAIATSAATTTTNIEIGVRGVEERDDGNGDEE